MRAFLYVFQTCGLMSLYEVKEKVICAVTLEIFEVYTICDFRDVVVKDGDYPTKYWKWTCVLGKNSKPKIPTLRCGFNMLKSIENKN